MTLFHLQLIFLIPHWSSYRKFPFLPYPLPLKWHWAYSARWKIGQRVDNADEQRMKNSWYGLCARQNWVSIVPKIISVLIAWWIFKKCSEIVWGESSDRHWVGQSQLFVSKKLTTSPFIHRVKEPLWTLLGPYLYRSK